MKNLEEAIMDAFIEGIETTLKTMKNIRNAWKSLDPAVKKEATSGISAIEEVKNNFPKDLAELLTFEIKEDCAIVRPRHFLGSDNFAKIAAIVRNLGGEYISAGKESHFKIPKK
jgi:hypothetical protein